MSCTVHSFKRFAWKATLKDTDQEQWRRLCEQAEVESDPLRFRELISEINRMLEKKEKKLADLLDRGSQAGA